MKLSIVLRACGWCLAVLLLTSPAWLTNPGDVARDRGASLIERLLGPFAGITASAQWVRADLALRRGDYEVAYARAESALELAPSVPDGWIFLARHFVYERAALEREPNVETRRNWVQAGLDMLDRGEARAGASGALAFERGVMLSFLAEIAGVTPPEDCPRVGGPRALFDEAADAFDRAALAGHVAGREAAASARQRGQEFPPR